MEKQIEEKLELSEIIDYAMRDWDDYLEECHQSEIQPIDDFEDFIAGSILHAGYRKQAEGHWITRSASYECSECGEEIDVDNAEDYDPVSDYDLRFCYYCGAKMKGE